MQTILTVLHLFLAIGLIGLVLIQHGRGADAGAAFGSGASATVFGARGSGSFLSRSTAVLAALFFVTSMALAYFAAQVGEPKGLMEGVEAPAPLQDGGAVPAEPIAATPAEVPGVPAVPVPAGEGTITDVPAVPAAEPAVEVAVPAAPAVESEPSGQEQPAAPAQEPAQPAGN